jgi:hypothetical protein
MAAFWGGRLRATAGIVALALALAACTGGGSKHTTAPSSTTTKSEVNATERGLANAGIATVPDEKATTAAVGTTGSPDFTLTAWQVANLSCVASSSPSSPAGPRRSPPSSTA